MRSSATVILALLLGLGACGAPPGPGETYRTYLSALSNGDLDQAFELLSQSSRDRLARAEAAWRKARNRPEGGTAPLPDPSPPGREYFQVRIAGRLGQDYPPLPADAADLVESVRQAGDRAFVMVRTPLGLRTAPLVLENGNWKVDLQF